MLKLTMYFSLYLNRRTLIMKRKTILFLAILISAFSMAQNGTQVIAYNNLHNKNAIWEMFGHGISSFQVDVMYIYGDLYVTAEMPDSANHSLPTLQDAYLFPLFSSYKKNGNTSIISGKDGDSFLILNIHNEFDKANARLKELLAPMHEFITYYKNGWNEGKIRLLVNDKTYMKNIEEDQYVCLGIVGSQTDLDTDLHYHQMPLIEVDFSELTDWKGTGNIPFNDYIAIKSTVSKIHQKSKKISVVNCPNHEAAWEVLSTSKVDFINTNNPVNVCNFLEGKQ